MNKIQLTKAVVNLIVGIGTTKIVNDTVSHTTHPETTVDKIAVTSSATVMGYMAAEKTRTFTDAKIDEMAAWFATNVKKN